MKRKKIKKNPARYKITWNSYLKLCYVLVIKIQMFILKHKGTFDGVVGIPRGGLIPAVLVSHCAKLPLLEEKDIKKGEVYILVDDVSDTGVTLEEWQERFMAKGCGVVIATLHTKPWTRVQPYWHIEETEKWLIYPYESEDKVGVRNNTSKCRRKK